MTLLQQRLGLRCLLQWEGLLHLDARAPLHCARAGQASCSEPGWTRTYRPPWASAVSGSAHQRGGLREVQFGRSVGERAQRGGHQFGMGAALHLVAAHAAEHRVARREPEGGRPACSTVPGRVETRREGFMMG
ncbi:hypothetical protein ACVGVM_16950 [Pseudonocardia bannensis]|uniref:Uncharacterized protein n=1 Tax=Pseudonocardia bannensis TaxID=630973 RepID=A0A848DG93_9PSEU|nr:hypothetical protein [Pseudonocardia bannensis]NMH91682.1 hypothetical protein [Pseudonocardia bannensis]